MKNCIYCSNIHPSQQQTEGEYMENDEIFAINKLLYVIAAIAVVVVMLDINVWRAVA